MFISITEKVCQQIQCDGTHDPIFAIFVADNSGELCPLKVVLTFVNYLTLTVIQNSWMFKG